MSESTTEAPQYPGAVVVEPSKASKPRKRAAASKPKASKSKKAAAAKPKARERKTQPLKPALIKRVHQMSAKGKKLQEIADALNKSGETTARGLPWTTQNVWHVLRRKSQ